VRREEDLPDAVGNLEGNGDVQPDGKASPTAAG